MSSADCSPRALAPPPQAGAQASPSGRLATGMSPRKRMQKGGNRTLPVFEPPPGFFGPDDVPWALVRHKGLKRGLPGVKTVRIRRARVEDFHNGMRLAGGCNKFICRDGNKEDDVTGNFRCPKSKPEKDTPARAGADAGAAAPPAPARAVAGRRRRGLAKPKAEAYGEQCTDCSARYTVSYFGSETVILRLLCGTHNHPTDTTATFVSQPVRKEIEAEWLKYKAATPFGVVARNIRARVLRDYCAAHGRDEATVMAAWHDPASGKPPPRDYVLTEKFVRDYCAQLESEAMYHKNEAVAVDLLRAAHPEKVFHFVPGAPDDENDVRRCPGLAAPSFSTLLQHPFVRLQHPFHNSFR